MNTLLRTVETPRYSREIIQARFPDYKLVGDRAGWFYPVHQTKVVLISTGWKSLVDDVRAHLAGNELPVDPALKAQMEEWWCTEVEDRNCGAPAPVAATDTRALAERFLRTVKSFVFSGAKRVSQVEAERRAAICANCPMNRPDNSICVGCFLGSLLKSAISVATGWSSSRDSELHSCGTCGCKLSLKIWIPKSDMDYKELRGRWPEGCWMGEKES